MNLSLKMSLNLKICGVLKSIFHNKMPALVVCTPKGVDGQGLDDWLAAICIAENNRPVYL